MASTIMIPSLENDPYVFTRSYQAVLAPILSSFAIVLSSLTFVWYINSRNIAASAMIGWTILQNIFVFMNALIWPNDDISNWWHGAGLCDIQVKLQYAASTGVVGALVCIFRSLAIVLDTDRTVLIPSKARRRRTLAIDLLLSFGIPIYMVIIHHVVSLNRYIIYAIYGCITGIYPSWLSIVLIEAWGPVLCLAACYYAMLVIFRLYKYRKQFSSILSASDSKYNKSRYLRLFVTSLVLIFLITPIQLYVFLSQVVPPVKLYPYSWSAVHNSAWNQIIMWPTFGNLAYSAWIRIAAGYLIFIFWGMGRDAIVMYRAWLVALGFARLFPTLKGPYHPKPSRFSNSLQSFGSKASSGARLFFRKGTFSFRSRNNTNQNNTAISVNSHSSALQSTSSTKNLFFRTNSNANKTLHRPAAKPWYRILFPHMFERYKEPGAKVDRHGHFSTQVQTSVTTDVWSIPTSQDNLGHQRGAGSVETSDGVRVEKEISQMLYEKE